MLNRVVYFIKKIWDFFHGLKVYSVQSPNLKMKTMFIVTPVIRATPEAMPITFRHQIHMVMDIAIEMFTEMDTEIEADTEMALEVDIQRPNVMCILR